MQTVTIETRYGKAEIKAAIVGPLCVHKSLNDVGSWDVTHTESSLRVGWQFKTRRAAIEAAKAMDRVTHWEDALNAYYKGHVGALGAIRGRLIETLAGLGFHGHC